jgi:hypothetical protein
VVLLKVDAIGVGPLKFECQAPWAVDVHGIALWQSVQRMKAVSRTVHLFGGGNAVQKRVRMRLCILLSIFDAFPAKRSASALLRKLLITGQHVSFPVDNVNG